MNKIDTETDLVAYAAVFKALSDPTRLTIFSMLRSACAGRGCGRSGCDPHDEASQRTLSDLADALGIGAPTVSHHIKELRLAGLIICERRGRNLSCSINLALLRKAGRFLVTAA